MAILEVVACFSDNTNKALDVYEPLKHNPCQIAELKISRILAIHAEIPQHFIPSLFWL